MKLAINQVVELVAGNGRSLRVSGLLPLRVRGVASTSAKRTGNGTAEQRGHGLTRPLGRDRARTEGRGSLWAQKGMAPHRGRCSVCVLTTVALDECAS